MIVDQNGLQGFGRTSEVADLAPLAHKFEAFGVTTVEVDGHDHAAVAEALRSRPDGGPLIVVARTTKGCGFSFMEDRLQWHCLPMTAQQYEQASREVDDA